ncbi:MAG TPA: acyl-CoA desaturase [Jatrophihabitantaceae bacterium]|nr:acyl-CoA desaturase [Jatrophihabitantaceae bacterium]
MTNTTLSRKGSDFAALSRQVRSAGLLERRRWSYALRIALTVSGYAATWWVFVALGDSWYQMIVAAIMGIAFTQIAFLGHDGGHQQVARTKRVNDVLGLITGDLLVGLCFGWWVDEHSQHHAHPNHEGRDPDIGDSVITFTPDQAGARTGPIERFIAAYQAWLFFPLLTLEGINLHVQSIDWLRRAPNRRYRRTELILLVVNIVAYLGAIFVVLSPGKAFAFIAIQQAAWGVYMGCSFAPNHKGMPTIPAGQTLDFLRCQVLTSRNIRGGRFTDVLLGGLNYQVEHHLFPNMPRNNLRKAQPMVKAYCADLRIPYTETGLINSYAIVLRHLNSVGRSLRPGASASSIGT